MLAQTLHQRLASKLEQELDAVTDSQSNAQSGMTHAESRAENDKDTRAIESSYLARGLASRVGELKSALATIQAWTLPEPPTPEDKILLGRVITLQDADTLQRQVVWLAPAGGGQSLRVDRLEIVVLTPSAPLGRALLGRHLDDEVEVQSPRGTKCWLIERVE